jgi:hypothetical protein
LTSASTSVRNTLFSIKRDITDNPEGNKRIEEEEEEGEGEVEGEEEEVEVVMSRMEIE